MVGLWKRPPSGYNTVMPNPDLIYPWPCDRHGSRPSSPSQHVLLSIVKAYQSKGYMKRCVHLEIPEPPLIKFRQAGSIYFFEPQCEKDAFDFHRNDDGQPCFYGCPKDCLLYQPTWRSTAKNFLDKYYWSLRDGVIGIFQYYASLSKTVQVIIALAFLAWLGSPWANIVLEIVKPYLPK